ncbi:hemolysin [Putridiphycobacter roseus]|uniref:Hemolysin n=1 Tax=Putridiphycobacter roseus TaxID=2219161 RepID=A0A2W1MZ46_9FLAO|nr:hemolysin family protein [Putridiphycobacter roseus]PZE16664.1 hemolysin [Putridiphycobacter roseus]
MISIIILISLIASAFFSGMEIAFISANRLKIELEKNNGALSGRVLSYFVRNESNFISTMLLGNNIALVVYGIYMAKALAPSLESIYPNQAFILISQTIISTLIVLVTAEFLPKAIFRINPNWSLTFFSFPLFLIYWILIIPSFVTTYISRLFLKIFGVNIENTKQAFSKVDLDDYVRDISDRMENEFEMENEIQILQNALAFSTTKARDCMVPRTEITAVNIEISIEELKTRFIETGFSKILVYRDSIDNLIGYVHSYELFKKPIAITQILLPISIVPEAILIKILLEQFTAQKRSVAVVVDEFGGTSGMITVEDIIEEIFGEIEDEHDSDILIEEQIDENTYLFSARIEIGTLNDRYNFNFEEMDEYETLGGLIYNELEEIPEKGTKFVYKNYLIVIEEVSSNKVELVKVKIDN